MCTHAHKFFEIGDLMLYLSLCSKLKIEYKCTKYQIIGSIQYCLRAEVINKYHTVILTQ